MLSPLYEDEVESPACVPDFVSESGGTVFENKYTQEYLKGEEKVKKDPVEEIIGTGDDKEAAIFVNRLAHDVEFLKKEQEFKFPDSPLAKHTPKILTHPIKGMLCQVCLWEYMSCMEAALS